MKYKFAVGLGRTRTVTVEADTLDDADLAAREELDRRAEAADEEPPVGWDLFLINAY